MTLAKHFEKEGIKMQEKLSSDFCPIIVVAPTIHEGSIRLRFDDKDINIEPEFSERVWEVLSFCDGTNSLKDISRKIKDPEATGIISDLAQLGVIVDSRKQYLVFHKMSSYPTPYAYNRSQAEIMAQIEHPLRPLKEEGRLFRPGSDVQLLRERHSCRSFSPERLTANQIIEICHVGYSSHAVPSAGSLYPLRIFVILRKAQEDLPEGYYEYRKDGLLLFCEQIDFESLNLCFNTTQDPFGSTVQIVITADLSRQTDKYANRGYRFTLIEVGHAAENISLYCTEHGLGCLELGGILDEPLKEELELPGEVWPLLAIAIGKQAKSKEPENLSAIIEDLQNKMRAKLTKQYVRILGEDAPFFAASVKFGWEEDDVAGATSTSEQVAIFKAYMEGYERAYSSAARQDFAGSVEGLVSSGRKPYIPGRVILPSKCRKHDDSLLAYTRWTAGSDLISGETVYIPSSYVYYGEEENLPHFNPSYMLTLFAGLYPYDANSSGMSAHLDRKLAIKGALLELVERDAFMRMWYAQKPPVVASDAILPLHAVKRCRYWEKQARELRIVLLPSPYATVVAALLRGEEYPCFAMGMSATLDDFQAACIKAIQEAEYSYVCYKDESRVELTPRAVSTPHQHGQYYCSLDYARQLDWLFTGGVYSEKITSFLTYDQLVQRLEPVVVDLKTEPISIVRVFSHHLVPINFGLGTPHLLHKAIKEVNPTSLKNPHCFA